MTTPSTGELLVKEAKSAERLEIMAMAEKAKRRFACFGGL